MPNVILPNLGIELPDVGSDQDTWGDILNADLQILDNAVQYDVISKTLSNVDVTLTAAEAASAVINLTGTLLANVNVIVPVSPVRLYLVNNGTTGAFTVTVKTPLGTGVTVLQGANSLVYSNGTNIVQGATSVNGSFAVSGVLTAGSINNTPVGNTTPSSGAFTTLSASGAASFADGTAALPSITNTSNTNTGVYFPAADTVAIATGGLERLQVDPAGNAGLGVVPSAWGGGTRAFQFGALNSISDGSLSAAFGRNFYESAAGVFRYITNGSASAMSAENGGFTFRTAPPGTAGNPITFTQTLTLFQAGQFLLGATSLSAGAFAEFTSTTGALIVPRMTTAQRDAMGAVANGAIIYNTTTNKMNFRENGAWVQPTVTAA